MDNTLDFIMALPKLPSFELKRGLLANYDITYGVSNSILDDNPLASVLYSETEADLTMDILRERLEAYSEQEIRELTGWTFSEFIKQPRPIVQMVLELSVKRQKDRQAALEAAGLLTKDPKK